jgi:hypothetical protein
MGWHGGSRFAPAPKLCGSARIAPHRRLVVPGFPPDDGWIPICTSPETPRCNSTHRRIVPVGISVPFPASYHTRMNKALSQAPRSQQDSCRLNQFSLCDRIMAKRSGKRKGCYVQNFWTVERASRPAPLNPSEVKLQCQLQLPRSVEQIAARGQLPERIALQTGAARAEAMAVEQVKTFGAEFHFHRLFDRE